MLKEFKEFIMRGNVIDLAVGIVIGAAFGAVVNSLVKDIITPVIGLIWGKDFTNLFWTLRDGTPPPPPGGYPTRPEALAASAVTMNIGNFINFVITFLIVAFAIFLLIKAINTARRAMEKPKGAAAVTTKDCPYCQTSIPVKASRCPNCTSELKTA